MIDSAASPMGAKYSLNELFVIHLVPYAASFTKRLGASANTGSGASALSRENLQHAVLKNYEEALRLLGEHNFVPSTRVADFAAALTAETCITATALQDLCGLSNDTATRWLNKAVSANLLRRITVGKKYAYINLLHFALIQDLPIPLSDIPSATGLKANKSQRLQFANPSKYLDAYPPKYLESIQAPF
jgi:hypothetical protein